MDLSKGLPVSIHLETEVDQGGEHTQFIFDLMGQIVTIGDTIYIRYKETTDEGQQVPVTLKVEPDGKVQLTRSGENRMRLKFDYRRKIETFYQTPYGQFAITTFTKDMHFSLRDTPVAGALKLDYELLAGPEKMGDYRLSLQFSA